MARKAAPSSRKSANTRASSVRATTPRAKPAARSAKPAKRSPAPAKTAPETTSGPATTATGNGNGIGAMSQHMDYTSHAMDEMKRFYVDKLGFPDYRLDPAVDYLYVRTGPSSSLGFMPPMPGPPEQWRPPREPAIYMFVADVDRAHRELVGKGVTFEQEPTDMPWGHRLAILRDPEGRTVCLAQDKLAR